MTLLEALRDHQEISDSVFQACAAMPVDMAEEMLLYCAEEAEINLAALQACHSIELAPDIAAVSEAFFALQATAYDFLIHALPGERADLLAGRDTADGGVITFATAWKRHQEATAALLFHAHRPAA